mgnify:CR=1 FL=1
MKQSSEATAPRPLPLADEASAGFWDAAKAQRLDIQRCTRCRRWNHAPSLACPSCGSFDLTYETVSGKGTLFSWTVLQEAPAPGFRDMLPLIVGVVELAEQEHLVLAANILETSVAELRLGMALEVVFEKVSDDCTLPQFRPVRV